MHLSDIPHSTFIVASSDEDILADAIGKILGDLDDEFYYQTLVQDTSRSERLFSREKLEEESWCINDAYAQNANVRVQDLAYQLILMNDPKTIPPARYNPPAAPPGKQKGWEILLTSKMNEPVVLARAIWI